MDILICGGINGGGRGYGKSCWVKTINILAKTAWKRAGESRKNSALGAVISGMGTHE